MDSWSLVRSHRTATLLPRTQPYLRTEIKILSAKLPAASSEYPCLGSRRACTNCLAKQRKSHHKYLNNNETHRRILPQEPTALSLARRGSANRLGFEALGWCRSEAETRARKSQSYLRSQPLYRWRGAEAPVVRDWKPWVRAGAQRTAERSKKKKKKTILPQEPTALSLARRAAPVLRIRSLGLVPGEQRSTGGANPTSGANSFIVGEARKRQSFGIRSLGLVPERSADRRSQSYLRSQHSVAYYLRRLHNLACDLGWLAWRILAKRVWKRSAPSAAAL